MLLGVIKHFGPVIPLVDGFVGEGSSPSMVFIVVVNLLHYAPDLLGSEAPQVQVGV